MNSKTSIATRPRSPYFCCNGVVSSTFIKTALLSTVLVLLMIFVILVLIGALYGNRNSAFFFVSAAILLAAAAMLTVFYVWLNRKRTLLRMQYPSKMLGKSEVSTISGLNYCTQVPTGYKTDFPMGPYVVMTLPRTNNYRCRSNTIDTDSNPNTPKILKKKLAAARRAKNLPPLASAETLTPSLLSSCYGSIDSVV